MDIEKKVLLLGILTKKEDETLMDVLITLENSKVFSLKKGKQYLKELKKEGLIVENELSVTGLVEAKKAKEEFTI